MTTPERRQTLYSKMLLFMRKHEVNTVPFDIQELCRRAKIELVPLTSIAKDTGIQVPDIFSIWGNEDGAVHLYSGRYRIAYNDLKPRGRVRFTLCEEISHIVYGHIEDPEFNAFLQAYDSEKYARYDEEARLGAGLLACHPKFFYTFEWLLSPKYLAQICGISEQCAIVRQEIMTKYKKEITLNMSYQFSHIPHTQVNLRQIERMVKAEREKSHAV